MQEKSNPSYFEVANHYAFLKLELANFTDKQSENFRSLVTLSDQFMIRQRGKTNFQPEDYSRELNLLLAELEIYFTNIVVHLASFPMLGQLAKILQKIMNHYNRVFSFSMEYWLEKFKQLKREAPQLLAISPPPSMEMCMHCSENIRHQQIKKARYRLYNPIEDPFLMFSNGESFKPDFVQEIKQKELQDRLSELASNLQLGQNCMREMIDKINADGQFVGEQHNHERDVEDLNLPVIPVLKSMFKYMKVEKKIRQEIGVQTDSEKQEMEDTIVNKSVCVKANIKMAAEITDKTHQIKFMEEKIAETQKVMTDLMNQVTVLRETNHTLQKRNSALEVELNISIAHSKLTKNNKRTDPTKTLFRKVEDQTLRIQKSDKNAEKIKDSKEIATNLEEQLAEKTRKSLKAEGKIKKLQVAGGSPVLNKTNITTFNPTQPNLRYRNNDIVKDGSSFSIEQKEPYEVEDAQPDIQVFAHLNPPLLEEINLRSQSLSPRQSVGFVRTPSLMKVPSSMKRRDMIRSQNPSPQRNRRIRRLGTIYQRDQILKILFQEEIKNKDSSADFQAFKAIMNSVISKALSSGVKENKDREQKQTSLYTAKEKTRFRHIPKKNALSIKQTIRNQATSRVDILKELRTTVNEPRNSDLLSIEETVTAEEKKALQNLKANLFIDDPLIEKISEKKVVLANTEIHLMTQLMAYMIQLKVTNKNRYYMIKKTIFSHISAPQGATEKEQLQMSLSHILSQHRTCTRLEGEGCCHHLKKLMNCTIDLLS